MDLTQFVNVSGVMLGILPPVLVVCAFVLLWARTQSRHVLLYRLWRLLHGAQPIHDPEVNAFIEEQTSLMSFRFLTGVQAKTLESARELIQWAKFHDVEMHEIATCGNYFDPDLRRVQLNKITPTWMQRLRVGAIILTSLLVLCLLAGLGMNDPLLKFKSTNHWFFLNANNASVVWPLNAEPLMKTDCGTRAAGFAQKTEFEESEVATLCSILTSLETPAYVEKTVTTQRISFVATAFFLAFLVWMMVLQSEKDTTAKLLHQRHLSPDIAGGQMNLKLDEN